MDGYIIRSEAGFGACMSSNSKWLVDVDVEAKRVKVLCAGGVKPLARPFVAATLECDSVKEAIRAFLSESDDALYRLDTKVGVSGCQDLILKTAVREKGFEVVKSKVIMHITMYDKVDRDYYTFSFRELVELAVYFNLDTTEKRVDSCEQEEVKFFKPQGIDDTFSKGSMISFD